MGLALGMNLKFYTSVAKGLKLKVRKFWGLFRTFVEVTGKKLLARVSLPLPRLSWIGLKYFQIPFVSDIETGVLFLTSTCFNSNNSNIFKLARKENGDELMLLVKYSLITFPFNIFYFLKYVLFFFVDLHLVKQTLRNPPKRFWKDYLHQMEQAIVLYSNIYENNLLINYFNVGIYMKWPWGSFVLFLFTND